MAHWMAYAPACGVEESAVQPAPSAFQLLGLPPTTLSKPGFLRRFTLGVAVAGGVAVGNPAAVGVAVRLGVPVGGLVAVDVAVRTGVRVGVAGFAVSVKVCAGVGVLGCSWTMARSSNQALPVW